MWNLRRTGTAFGLNFLGLAFVTLWVGCGAPQGKLLTNLDGKPLVIGETILFKPKVGQVYVYHSHGAPLELTNVQVKGDQAVHFELVQAPAFPLAMEGGNQKGNWFNVQFFSSTAGAFQATLEIEYKTGEGRTTGTLLIPMEGTAVESNNPIRLQVEPETTVLDFGTIHNKEAISKEIVLYNTSESILTIDSLELVDNDKKAFQIPFPLPTPFRVFPGKENGRPVVFQAQHATPGTYEAWLSLSSENAGNLSKDGTRLIKLRVKIVEYQTPPRLRFRVGATGSSSYVRLRDVPANEEKVERVTLWNSGQIPAKIVKIFVPDDAEKAWTVRKAPELPFEVKGTTHSNGVDIEVVYKSSKPTGQRVQLQVDYLRDPNQPDSISSAVLQLEHEVSRAWYAFDCTVLNFGRVDKDSTTRRSCRIRNIGNIDVTISSIKYVKTRGEDSPFRWINPSFPLRMSPGSSYTVLVEYVPKTSGADDEGQFVPTSNIIVENEEERPVLRVQGQTNSP
ncbi:MAG: hypothetical protein EP343_28155 [Deltaproteobacteria bacterium]|nr:MAG: hypothetical protein EP343_28155 [Deltaproteobacteria bacterium]